MERGGGVRKKQTWSLQFGFREGKLREGFYNPYFYGATENGDTGQEVIYGKELPKEVR